MWRFVAPAARVRHVAEIDLSLLAERGIRALLLDLDNTLVPWGADTPDPRVVAWLGGARARGFGLCLVSNSRLHRVRRLAGALRLPWVAGGRKPLPGLFRKALDRLTVAPPQAAVVGDQLLTDVLGGNLLGMYTILVDPVSPREFAGTRLVMRPLERWILEGLGARGLLKPPRV